MKSRALIIGGTGFLGTKLTTSNSKWIEFETLHKNAIDLPKSMSTINTIIYLRALSSPTQVQQDPVKSNEINVFKTSRIIKECLELGKRVIFASSDVVYGNTGNDIASETSALNPFGLYAMQKAKIETIFGDRQNFLALRLSLMVGEGSRLRNMLLNEKGVLIPNPVVRNPIGVKCVVGLIEKLVLTEIWDQTQKAINVGGPESMTILELATLESRILGLPIPRGVERYSIDRESRPQSVRISSRLGEDFLGSRFVLH